MTEKITIDKAEYERLKLIEKYAGEDIDWDLVAQFDESLEAVEEGRVIET